MIDLNLKNLLFYYEISFNLTVCPLIVNPGEEEPTQLNAFVTESSIFELFVSIPTCGDYTNNTGKYKKFLPIDETQK